MDNIELDFAEFDNKEIEYAGFDFASFDFTEIDSLLGKWDEDIIATLSKLISFKSVKSESKDNMPFGEGIGAALDFMLDLCENEGLVIKNGSGYYGYADLINNSDKQNSISTPNDRLIGVFGHLDVVPSGDDWDNDPFLLQINKETLIARGVVDDKGPLISAFYAIKAINYLNINIKSNVRLFFGCDEETSFKCISKYIESEKIPDYSIVVDANYPVTNAEKGVLTFELIKTIYQNDDQIIKVLSIKGGEKENIVPGSCETILELSGFHYETLMNIYYEFDLNHRISIEKITENTIKIKANGIKAHSSLANEGLSAITITMMFLDRLSINGDIGDIIRFYSHKIGFKCNGSILGIEIPKDKIDTLTVNIGLVELSSENIRFAVDIRYPHFANGSHIIKNISDYADKFNIKVITNSDFSPMYYTEDSFLVKTLLEIYNQYHNTNHLPITIGSSTYAHNLKNAVAFGPNHPGEIKFAHKANEIINRRNMIDNAKLYARAILALSTATST